VGVFCLFIGVDGHARFLEASRCITIHFLQAILKKWNSLSSTSITLFTHLKHTSHHGHRISGSRRELQHAHVSSVRLLANEVRCVSPNILVSVHALVGLCVPSSSHIMYDQHTCSQAHMRDAQVPVCPLCKCCRMIKSEQLEVVCR
jgi:hypothetical protein